MPSSAWACGLVLAVTLLALAGCGLRGEEDRRPLIAVSVPPQSELVRAVAGPGFRVVTLLPPGANPATYAPTLAERLAVAEAALLVEVGHPGLPFERVWIASLIADRPQLPVVRMLPAEAKPEAEGDPHLWTDPQQMGALARRLAAALQAGWPADAAGFGERLARFEDELAQLDRELREILAPVRGRRFYVFHPAWGPFARAYGLEQVAIEHEHKEPGPRELSRVIERARADHVRVIFVQPQFDPASARVVAEAIGAKMEVLDPLAPDWAENLRRVARQLREALLP